MRETSERLSEGRRSGTALWELHMAAYRWAAQFAAGARVLDFGCGTGYGAAFLADTASHVTGYDIDEAAIAYAREHYGREGVEFTTGPPESSSYDLVLSFQVIEHVDPDAYLADALRALRPGGRLLLTTPNRVGRLYRWQKPWNRWHLTEYDRDGLTSILRRYFARVEPWAVKCSPDIEAAELSRYRRMQHMLMPATLIPWYPIRFGVLSLAAKLFARGGQKSAETDGTVEIVPEGPDSICLAAVAEK